MRAAASRLALHLVEVVDPVDQRLLAAMMPPEVLVDLESYAALVTKCSDFRTRFRQSCKRESSGRCTPIDLRRGARMRP
jgi:hypothetical protein